MVFVVVEVDLGVCTSWVGRVEASNPTQPEHIGLEKNESNPTQLAIMIGLGWVGLIRLDIFLKIILMIFFLIKLSQIFILIETFTKINVRVDIIT